MRRRWPTLLAAVSLAGLPGAAPGRDPGAGQGSAPAASQTDPTAADASAGGALGLGDFAALALAQYPTVAAARALVEAADRDLAAALADRLPGVDASLAAVQHGEPMPVTPIHGFTPGQIPEFDETLVQGRLDVAYTLFDGGARRARVDRQRARAGGAAATADQAARDLVAAAAGGYLEVLALAAELDAHRGRLGALQAERERVERFLEAGRAAEVELRRAEAVLAAAEAEEVRLAAALRTAEGELARFAGVSREAAAAERLAPVAWAAAGDTPPEAMERAVAGHPQVLAAEQELAGAEAALALAESTRRPALRLAGSLQELGSGEGSFSSEWNAGAYVAVDVFDGGRARAQVASAAATRDAAAERVRLARLGVESALDRAIAAVAEAAARAQSLERSAAAAAEVARIEALRLESGVGTQSDYLEAQAALLAARAGLARSRYATARGRVEVQRLVGPLDPAWLADNLEVSE